MSVQTPNLMQQFFLKKEWKIVCFPGVALFCLPMRSQISEIALPQDAGYLPRVSDL